MQSHPQSQPLPLAPSVLPTALFELDKTLVDPFGTPVSAEPDVVGLVVYEAEGGAESLELLAELTNLRKRRERSATLIAGIGALIPAVRVEIELFNQEVYRKTPLSDRERATITAAVLKREVRAEKRRTATAHAAVRATARAAAQAQENAARQRQPGARQRRPGASKAPASAPASQDDDY